MMTWKEFKEMCESQGITDDSKLGYIDISGYELPEDTTIEDRGQMGWVVWS